MSELIPSIYMLPHHCPVSWKNDAQGELRLSVEHYLNGQELIAHDLALLSAYLVYWLDAPVWEEAPHLGPQFSRDLLLTDYEEALNWFAELGWLQEAARRLSGRTDISNFLARANAVGLFPL